MLHEFGNINDAMLDKIKVEKGYRLKAFYPWGYAAIFGTWRTSWLATTLCLYVHVGINSMGYEDPQKSYRLSHQRHAAQGSVGQKRSQPQQPRSKPQQQRSKKPP